MSWPLLKYFIKKNWFLWAAFTGFLLFELVVVIFMMEMISDLTAQMGFGDILGGAMADVEVDGAYAMSFVSTLFPMYACMFPMVFYIMTLLRILSKPVETTSLSAHLTAGIPRWKYLTTAAVFIVGSLVAMFALVFVIAGVSMLHWGKINWADWLNLNVSFFFVNLGVAALCFFFASVFAASKLGVGLTIGLPILFIVLHALSDYSSVFKYMTMYGWVSAEKMAVGAFDLWWLCDLGYLAITAVAFTASLLLFKRKQLNI